MGTKEGIWKTRTVRRRSQEQRWSIDNISMIVGVPLKKNGENNKAVGEGLKGGVIKIDEGVMEDAEKKNAREVTDTAPPQAFHTKKEDYDKHGYTRGCIGCRALLTGTSRQKHSVECRRLMEKEMIDLDHVTTAKRRRATGKNEKYMERDRKK